MLLYVLGKVGPHAAGTAAERPEASHERNRDEGNDQSIFDRGSATLVSAQPAKIPSDSVQATLLWSTSTPSTSHDSS
jgi:hypothetical protein